MKWPSDFGQIDWPKRMPSNLGLKYPTAGHARSATPEEHLNLETAVQPKETKEAKGFEGFTQTRTHTCRVKGA